MELKHYGKKGMQWGVVNEEEGASPSGTRPVALTKAENRADPDGPDRRAQIKKAALIAGGTALIAGAAYGAYRLNKSGVSLSSLSDTAGGAAKKVLQPPTDIIHLARGRNKGLKFHATGNTPDFFGIFDGLGLNGSVDNGYFSKTVDGTIASRFLDPLARHDFAGRPISHDVVVPPNMSAGINSTSDVVDKVWPKIKDSYQKFWDESLEVRHSDLEGEKMSSMEAVSDMVDNILAQHGVKGMKWGVRNDKGHEGESAKTKKIAKLDKKFERNSQSLSTTIKIHNAAAEKTNKLDVDRINNKPEYKDADFRRDSPLRQQYYKEHQRAFLDRLDEAAQAMGTNASGTKEYRILELEDGSWDVGTYDVKHADTATSWNVKVNYDDSGHITSIGKKEETDLTQADNFVTAFLAHYGVPGMKWGVRKNDSSGPTPAVAKQKRPGAKVKTTGGEGVPAHADAKKAAEHIRTAKKSRKDALSNDELQAAIRRMQLEQQFDTLSKGRQNAGKKFVMKLLGDTGADQARAVAGTQAAYQIDKQLTKRGKPVAAKSKYKFTMPAPE